MLIRQSESVGLLLAAESVLRFSDRNARGQTDYVIIGTLLGFGWDIVMGVLARAGLTP